MRIEIHQGLRFELSQGFTDRHPADAEGRGQLFLTQRRAAGQGSVQNRLFKRCLDELGRGAKAGPGPVDELNEIFSHQLPDCRLDPIQL
jgi:hypothetical protein